jgi:hypothetical protein
LGCGSYLLDAAPVGFDVGFVLRLGSSGGRFFFHVASKESWLVDYLHKTS